MHSDSRALPHRSLARFAGRESSRAESRPRAGRESASIRALANAPRWLFLGCLVFAPWAYGGTRPWAITTLSVALLAVQGLWWTGCAIRRRAPHLPILLGVPVVWLLVQGWWMTINGKGEYQLSLGVLLPVDPWLDWAPGSVESTYSLRSMLLGSGWLGAVLFVTDLARRPVWRHRLVLTLLGTGVSIAVLGLLLKLGGVPAMEWIWERDKIHTANNFAMFRYRGNAGAFMNLLLPLMILRAWLSFHRQESPGSKAAWISALFLLLAAIQFNPSRASWCLALALGLGTILAIAALMRRVGPGAMAWTRGTVATAAVVALLVAACLGAVLALGGWETSWNRLRTFGIDGGQRGAVMVYRTMVPDAGWLGFGPGTFETIFPAYQTSHAYETEQARAHWTAGYWRHAHQDYYQTLIEWGYLGALAWAMIFLGGFAAALRHFRRSLEDPSLSWMAAGAALALGGVLLHASVDFPLQIASIQLYAAALLGLCWTCWFVPKGAALGSN